ncbi:MAG: L-histidine N(alpha)-methyltransferase [Dehalococcoidia bacterium]
MTETIDRLRVDVYLNGNGVLDSLAEDVRQGLTASPKKLSPKYLYDDLGSDLFERITAQPEYYPTRAERALLEKLADRLVEELAPREIVELGSGSSAKTRVLLGAQGAKDHLRIYFPFDVSEGIVRTTALDLLRDFPFLHIHGIIGDFEKHMPLLPDSEGNRLVLFLGGTIGNLDPDARVAFLRNTGALLGPDDHLLIGLDLVKDKAIIEAAYNDRAGVTAAFNKNILSIMNRTLGADFEPDAFRHHAYFNERDSRIEMHLVAEARQDVQIPGIGLLVRIEAGESIWTESSYKFTRESLSDSLSAAGLRLVELYTNEDPEQLFGLALAARG